MLGNDDRPIGSNCINDWPHFHDAYDRISDPLWLLNLLLYGYRFPRCPHFPHLPFQAYDAR